MKCLDDHHRYELNNFESDKLQLLLFIKKEKNEAGVLETVEEGTTNEEVLAMLIHRLKGLNDKFGCRQNSLAITKLEEALFWLNDRTAERKRRGVEGTLQK